MHAGVTRRCASAGFQAHRRGVLGTWEGVLTYEIGVRSPPGGLVQYEQ